jgi:DNA replication protein DnaD
MSSSEIISLLLAGGMFLLEALGLWLSHRKRRFRKLDKHPNTPFPVPTAAECVISTLHKSPHLCMITTQATYAGGNTMPLFEFSNQYTMFDVTPVENLFIQEYMLRADGDFVKVYIYGLMQCYHPVQSASLSTIARDLGMEEARVENAYGYWERLGLVRRVADNPPRYAYQNLKQMTLMRAQDDDGLYRYADFNKSLQAQFGSDRLLHPQDFEKVYDWIEGLGLPEAVVLMLVSAQMRLRGKKFAFKSLDGEARKWAEAGVKTIADAEDMLRTYTEEYAAIRAVYKKLGKRHAVSEPDAALYRKWTQDWGFDQATILAACEETSKGVPTFGYVNGVLERMHSEGLRDEAALKAGQALDKATKALLEALGMRGTAPSDDTRALRARLLAEGFDPATLILAAQRVARKGGKLDALVRTLEIWKAAGALSLEAAQAYLRGVDEKQQQAAPPPPAQSAPKTVLFQRYTQREYTRQELERLLEDI